MTEICDPIPSDQVPRPLKYPDEYAAIEALEPGSAQPFKCADKDAATLLYQALWQWKIRKGRSDIVISKLGEQVHAERTT